MNLRSAITNEERHEVTGTYLNLSALRGREPTLGEVQKETHVHPVRVARFIRMAKRQKAFGFR